MAGKAWERRGIIDVPSQKEIDETCTKPQISSIYKQCGHHGVIITGYNDELKYLEFRNSWGPGWPYFPSPGDGYGMMSYDYFLKMHIGDNSMVTR